MTSTGYKINLTLDPLYKGELWVNGYLVSGCRITSWSEYNEGGNRLTHDRTEVPILSNF